MYVWLVVRVCVVLCLFFVSGIEGSICLRMYGEEFFFVVFHLVFFLLSYSLVLLSSHLLCFLSSVWPCCCLLFSRVSFVFSSFDLLLSLLLSPNRTLSPHVDSHLHAFFCFLSFFLTPLSLLSPRMHVHLLSLSDDSPYCVSPSISRYPIYLSICLSLSLCLFPSLPPFFRSFSSLCFCLDELTFFLSYVVFFFFSFFFLAMKVVVSAQGTSGTPVASILKKGIER